MNLFRKEVKRKAYQKPQLMFCTENKVITYFYYKHKICRNINNKITFKITQCITIIYLFMVLFSFQETFGSSKFWSVDFLKLIEKLWL